MVKQSCDFYRGLCWEAKRKRPTYTLKVLRSPGESAILFALWIEEVEVLRIQMIGICKKQMHVQENKCVVWKSM